jgi:hypothetical protein
MNVWLVEWMGAFLYKWIDELLHELILYGWLGAGK